MSGIITTVNGRAHLVGGRCPGCATHTFPQQASCPCCGGPMEPQALPADGTVWSWTVQRFAPKTPYLGATPYQPFALAYVDLGPVKVETPLSGLAIDDWKIGQPVRLVVDDPPVYGRAVSFSFEPVEAAS
jgi:uncharacterized protein